jgi:hypothetical protein
MKIIKTFKNWRCFDNPYANLCQRQQLWNSPQQVWFYSFLLVFRGWHAYQWKTPLQESSQSHRCITWCTTCIWLFHTCEILRYPRYTGPSRSSPFPPWTKTKDHNSTIRADQSCKAIQTYPRQSAPKWWSRRQIGLNGAEMQKRGIKYKQADPKSLHIWKFWGMKIRDSKYAVL